LLFLLFAMSTPITANMAARAIVPPSPAIAPKAGTARVLLQIPEVQSESIAQEHGATMANPQRSIVGTDVPHAEPALMVQVSPPDASVQDKIGSVSTVYVPCEFG
jgi:hypothetical protein